MNANASSQRILRILALGFALLGAVGTMGAFGCEGDGTDSRESGLSGDIRDGFDLHFDQVKAYRIGSLLVVAYQRDRATGPNSTGEDLRGAFKTTLVTP